MKKDEKTENKYQRGKIYKIISNQTEDVYIGSTCELYLCNRLSKHKSTYKQNLKGNYGETTSFQIVKYDDAMIVLIEKYPCNDKMELHKRERYHIDTNECVNKCRPGIKNELGKEKYYKQYNARYYEKNYEKIKLTQNNIYASKRDEKIAQVKKYNTENKDKVKKWKETKNECTCGSQC